MVVITGWAELVVLFNLWWDAIMASDIGKKWKMINPYNYVVYRDSFSV